MKLAVVSWWIVWFQLWAFGFSYATFESDSDAIAKRAKEFRLVSMVPLQSRIFNPCEASVVVVAFATQPSISTHVGLTSSLLDLTSSFSRLSISLLYPPGKYFTGSFSGLPRDFQTNPAHGFVAEMCVPGLGTAGVYLPFLNGMNVTLAVFHGQALTVNFVNRYPGGCSCSKRVVSRYFFLISESALMINLHDSTSSV